MSGVDAETTAPAALRARLVAIAEAQLRENPWLDDPEEATGACEGMSEDLVERLEREGIPARCVCLMGNLVPQHRRAEYWEEREPLDAGFYHVVVVAGGFYIDPSYRQIDREAPLPHIGTCDELAAAWLWQGSSEEEIMVMEATVTPSDGPAAPPLRPTSTQWVWADERLATIALSFAREHNEHLDDALLAEFLKGVGKSIGERIADPSGKPLKDYVAQSVLLEYRIEWPRRKGDPCRFHLAPDPIALAGSEIFRDVPLERRRAAARTWREWPELQERYGACNDLPPPGQAGVEMLLARAAAGPDGDAPADEEDEGPTP